MNIKLHKKKGWRQSGFTLVEVMLAIALTVILLFGVNFIFSTSVSAVRAGEALADATREQRGAQLKLFDDLNSVAKDAPFIIMMRTRIQYLNTADAQTSSSPNQIPIDNNGGTVQANPVLYGSRSHRVDVLEFCAHEYYERRTTGDYGYFSYTFGDDVWEHIGHANLPANDLSAWYGPDNVNTPQTIPPSIMGANASDWILNRTQIVLKDPSNIPIDLLASAPPLGSPGTTPWNYVKENFYPRLVTPLVALPSLNNGGAFRPYQSNLTPLSWYNNGTGATFSQLGDSRYDIAGCTLEEFKQLCAHEYNNQLTQINSKTLLVGSNYYLWCAPLMYYALNVAFPPPGPPWDPQITVPPVFDAAGNLKYLPLCDWPNAPGDGHRALLNRFNLNPTIQAPQTSASLAAMTPYLIQHCSQFIVEYAGDYMSQTNAGLITSSQPDGQVDFFQDSIGNHHIRWYGFPRKTSQNPGTGIRGYNGSDTIGGGVENSYQDVIPLSDYLCMINNTGNGQRVAAPFEVECNFAPAADYSAAGAIVGNDYSNSNDSRYAVAWYNTTPAMVRILMKVDDPNNALKDGPWYEYVFHLK